ncbi:MaoC family dehydratase [Amycolatopsis acidicola]|uniref:MaoC family dehydratase n=1 Tax=Amycolatopsis acidicola TaxID=2596893 RepID=A0A5N0VGD8_9PSEU|nr:MaoC family dehydratase [Amycolatopsis acidicola]KAA9164504.1 MaoC family dehydratase [Amycolatopsis acidicola]
MRTLHSIAELRALTGSELGVSAWHEVTQQRVDAFAAATDDFEDIHVDPARGAAAGFGGTIAHGLYTLSLGPKFLYEIYTLNGHSLGLNYGFDRVRFLTPVRTGARVRMKAELAEAREITGGTRFTLRQTFEIENEDKPACVAESVLAYFD